MHVWPLAPVFVSIVVPQLFSPVDRVAGGADAWDGTGHVVHEWGTFTSVQGSDGVALAGLTHEERDLPGFVYDLTDSIGLTGVTPKMETPVIYFYAPHDWRVHARASFPRGLITQWYPAVNEVNLRPWNPRRVTPGAPPELAAVPELVQGFVDWGARNELLVLGPDSTQAGELVPVADDDPWRYTREVRANLLRVCNQNLAREREAPRAYEYERFLFYRGLGDFELPLVARAFSEKLDGDRYRVGLHLENREPEHALTQLFLVHVENGRVGYRRLPDLRTPLDLGALQLDLRPFDVATDALVEDLAASLVATGLFADEALAMARTWQEGYFHDEGLRVLYVLPTAFVERELPLEIRSHAVYAPEMQIMVPGPEVTSLVRTFVGRLELLTPEREARMLRHVQVMAFGSTEERARSAAELEGWGRFGIPYLERVARLTRDPALLAEVESQLARLRAPH